MTTQPSIGTPAPAIIRDTVALPSSIDVTGTNDTRDALTQFLAGVPDGSTVEFEPDGIYALSGGLELSGRANLVLEGNGATLKQTGFDRSVLALVRSSNILVRNLNVLGDNPDSGTPDAYHPDGQEFSHGIAIQGSRDVEVAGVKISGVWGDGIFIASPAQAFAEWSERVSIHDSTIERNGRMGIVVNAGREVVVERVTFDEIAISVFDIEPDVLAEGATNVTFGDNTIGSYGRTSRFAAYLLEASGLDGSLTRGITLARNVVAGNPGGLDGSILGLNTLVDVRRAEGVWVTDNVSEQSADVSLSGAVLTFAHVDGLTVTGNMQPLSTERFLQIRDSTGVVSQ